MSLLDQFARHAAGGPAPEGDAALTRRTVVARGLVGALVFCGLGRLALPGRAVGMTSSCPRGSRSNCFHFAAIQYRRIIRECDSAGADPVSTLGCYRSTNGAWKVARRNCVEECPKAKKPPSKAKRPSKRKPPPAPPPLPPNPYDDAGLCANCAKVGGVCCWGGQLPGGFCACATPGIDCKQYGCS
jgi:hypothetical protein